MSETHLADLKFRLMTINLLKTAKKRLTYRELSSKTNLPVTVLSRYVKGHVLPSSSRAKRIWKTLETLSGLEEEIRRRIKFDEFGYFDNTSIVFDACLLQQAVQYAFSRFAGRRITKILTAAVDGVPLSIMMSDALGVELVVAKKTKEVGIRDFVEETYVPGNSDMVMSLYLPRGAIKKGDSVLIVDDVMKSGETQRALINLVTKSRADVAGVYILVSVGDAWKDKMGDLADLPLEVVLSIKRN
ncbi:MAG: phosphoribosyltransferase family protein [Candidatus Bathyarchaeota archaeon]